MARNNGGEFLEVFRRVPDKGAGEARRPRSRRPGLFAVPKRIEVSVGIETVIIGGFILITALLAAHIWGVRRGRAAAVRGSGAVKSGTHARSNGGLGERRQHRTADGGSVSGTARGLKTLSASNSDMTVPFWTVRIVGGIDLRSARALRDDLREAGYDAHVLKPSRENGYAIIVGRFPTRTDARAIATKERLSGLQDRRGNRPYRGAYMTQIINTGSIVP